MATFSCQSQFRWYLSLVLLVGCLILGLAGPAAATGYEPAAGGPFFLLSDNSFGTQDEAQVRFEAVDMGAIAGFGGADIAVYRVPKPLEFLQKQKNLHRVKVAGNYEGEGLSNALKYAWETWYVRSRNAWRQIFSSDARRLATREAPELGIRPGFGAAPKMAQNSQYGRIKGLDLLAQFRYPIHVARPIKPPAETALAGSSSEFIAPASGNVMIPLGKLKPGLYLVEASVGQHRATTLLFVADTVAITKTSASQMLVWAAGRRDGQPVASTRVVWTDGAGVLKSGTTNAQGVALFERAAPEQTYVMGQDPAGGVFISENFYYDSEIYNAKLYAVTDRPLYRPGDQVFIKVLGRDFVSARESRPVAAGELVLQAFDPNGMPVTRQKIALTPDIGADTSFRLPENAPAGGYEIRFEYKGDRYGAAFRVAEYQKPHFEIAVLPAKANFHTGEAVAGRLQLMYPDGQPVKNANLEISVRAQQMTMVDGDLGYAGQFPLKLTTASLKTDAKGIAEFSLPPATEPSRYVLTVFATDGAAYRVKASREILVERGAHAWTFSAQRQFTTAGEAARFTIAPRGEAGNPPVQWEWLRLENREKGQGRLDNHNSLTLSFDKPGSYTISLRDASGNVVAAASHFVGGNGAKAPVGSVSIVFDRKEYAPGDTAEALITFPVEVANALLTLERDKVEKTALLDGDAWIRMERRTPTQWRARMPVTEHYGPNITLSVAYVKDGDYVFQNQGLKVEQARIQLEFKTAKSVYAPGEQVDVEVTATLRGKPVATPVAVGVVDEMIYVLQPEIAPDILDFFYHPRRNNVRTSASLSFIGYDLAQPRGGSKAPSRRQVNERAVKLLERPRREDVDTAYWNPRLATDQSGRARFSFRMPDSLTRWRITGRAMDATGMVGQRLSWVRSEKPVYVKWTSPDWLREKDSPVAALALFNQTPTDQQVEIVAAALGKREALTLKPGVNFTMMPLNKSAGAQALQLAVHQNGKVIDSLEVPLHREPANWTSLRSLSLELKGVRTALDLPADANRIRVRFAASADAQMARIIDDLIDYPYGCVEQTASRLIPLALAVQATGQSDSQQAALLRQRLYSQRFRLAQMAGPNAAFGWWGDLSAADPFLTGYAYYADWIATRTLGLDLPKEHWDRLLNTYAKKGYQLPPLQRALMLAWMQEMGLPVGSLVDALANELSSVDALPPKAAAAGGDSRVFSAPAELPAVAAARLLTAHMQRGAATPNAALAPLLERDATLLRQSRQPFDQALLKLSGKAERTPDDEILLSAGAAQPTFERAMALVWMHRALGGKAGRAAAALPALSEPWRKTSTLTGQSVYVWPSANPLPKSLALAAAPTGKSVAFVDYESRGSETHSLPLAIERHLYRLVPLATTRQEVPDAVPQRGRSASTAELAAVLSDFELRRVLPGETLQTNALYLDEFVLRPNEGQVLHHGLLEVALPPGAQVEKSTWGISVRRKNGAGAPLDKARHEPTRYGYAVPFDAIDREITVGHLLRFAQKGRFELPPARFYRMYQPEQKAFERKDAAWQVMRID